MFSVWEGELANNKGPNGLPISRPLSIIVCLVVVARSVCCVMWAIWIILVCSHRSDSMVVADDLAAIWYQDFATIMVAKAPRCVSGLHQPESDITTKYDTIKSCVYQYTICENISNVSQKSFSYYVPEYVNTPPCHEVKRYRNVCPSSSMPHKLDSFSFVMVICRVLYELLVPV